MNTPRFEYSKSTLKSTGSFLAGLKAPYGLRVNYAVKANMHPEIIKIFEQVGLHFDTSSSYEAQALLDMGVQGKKITLSSQQSAHNLQELIDAGVLYTATSMHQLEQYAKLENRPKTVGVRVNPGVGSGINNRLITGGPNASFGIWHEYLDDAKQFCDENKIIIDHLQQHIGTGSDPTVWAASAHDLLAMVKKLPDVTDMSMGGGFKTAYRTDEGDVDIEAIIDAIGDVLEDFYADTKRKIQLTIEPGRFAVVHAGTLVAEVDDIVDTGKKGHTFLRLNTGMNDILRPSMYGAYHHIDVVNDSDDFHDYIVVGHNCETGDTLTVAAGDPESVEPRTLKKAAIGDEVRIHEAGAYCASMSAKGYNAFPDAEEVMVD